jgi:PAS domain S-box-containing protein
VNQAPPHEKINVLLVDDDHRNLITLEAALAELDENLVLAHSGTEALRELLHRDFAVVILDVQMPDMDGFEAARLIRARDRSKYMPIIFLTAISKASEFVRCGYELGAVDYLFKPFDPSILRSKVAVFVELYRNREAVKRQAEQLRALEERKIAKETLNRVRRQHERVLNSVSEGICGLDSAGRIIFANPAVAHMTGQRLEELVGRSEHEVFHHTRPDRSDYEPDECPIRQSIRHSKSIAVEDELFWRKDGTAFAVEYSSTPVRDEGDLAAVLVFKDITERKQIEFERARLVRELREAVQAREDFLSVASHELRTPLTPIRLGIQSLQRSVRPEQMDERLSGRLETINRQVDRMDKLITELLDVSRITVGRMNLERERIDFSELLRLVLERFNNDLGRCGHSISGVGSRPVIGHWDRLRIDQVLTNLFSNAIKYGNGKPIETSVEINEDLLVFSIRDHGIGISADGQARIFDRFERLVSVRHYGGFGLGLWIVRQIVEAHGGNIRVDSQPNQGSRFTVELPLGAKTEKATRKKSFNDKEKATLRR